MEVQSLCTFTQCEQLWHFKICCITCAVFPIKFRLLDYFSSLLSNNIHVFFKSCIKFKCPAQENVVQQTRLAPFKYHKRKVNPRIILTNAVKLLSSYISLTLFSYVSV